MAPSRTPPVDRTTSTPRTLALGLVAAQLALLAGIAVSGVLGRAGQPLPESRGAALACLAFAAWTGIPGARALGRRLTPMPDPTPGGGLVTTGMYARIRHPLYASTLALSLAWGLWWSSPAAVALSAILAALLHAKACVEERRLAERFPEYPEYARRVPRYLPSPFTRR
jgi:protein-S-isoprenylcysteine O-methyltransferase Ste14